MGHRYPKRDFNRGLGPRSDAVQVWCDGSAYPNPGPSSVGAVLVMDDHVYEVGTFLGDGTNNTAELRAIEVGLSLLGEVRDRPVDVYTDSQYAIAVVTGRNKAHVNLELIAQVRSVVERFSDLRFIWVKGHAGIGRNEQADRLATSARERVNTVGP